MRKSIQMIAGKKNDDKAVLGLKPLKLNRKKTLIKAAKSASKATKPSKQTSKSTTEVQTEDDSLLNDAIPEIPKDSENINQAIPFSTLPWREVRSTSLYTSGPSSSRSMVTGDNYGFLCLEEVDGVDIEVEEGLSGSKVIKFKNVKGKKGEKGAAVAEDEAKPAKPYDPPEIEHFGSFIHVDDFVQSSNAEPSKKKSKNKLDTTSDEADTSSPKPAKKLKSSKESKGETSSTEVREEVEKQLKPLRTAGETIAAIDPSKPLNKRQRQALKRAAREAGETLTAATEANEAASPAIDRKEATAADTELIAAAWSEYPLHPNITKALASLNYTNPTQIQKLTLSAALDTRTGHLTKRHVVGAAATGSGKTLAFGLPIAQFIALEESKDGQAADQEKESASVRARSPRPVTALVLTPTRELTIQVTEHLKAITKFTSALVVSVVGGMSLEKQRRVLSNYPDIIVATPGRLWELASEEELLMKSLRCARFLVLDEADRMMEPGHFKELDAMLRGIDLKRTDDTQTFEPPFTLPNHRQTFVFSATLTDAPDLAQRLANPKKQVNLKKKSQNKSTSPLKSLLTRLDLSLEFTALCDATTTKLLPDALHEARVECLNEDKDAVVYYLLAKFAPGSLKYGSGGLKADGEEVIGEGQGRTIVFVNSIDAVRRLVSVLCMLGVKAVALHAEMQQRQRLKSLDRFKADPHTVLVASDVAARGLDIPRVDLVVHYHLPRTTELYIHRSGRAARTTTAVTSSDDSEPTQRPGASLLLLGPGEITTYRRLARALMTQESGAGGAGGTDEAEEAESRVPLMVLETSFLVAVRKRVHLARKVEAAEHLLKKKKAEKDWVLKAAEEADMIVDDSDLDESDEEPLHRNRNKEKDANELVGLNDELASILQQPIFPQGWSHRYPTSNTSGANDISVSAVDAVKSAALNKSKGFAAKQKRKLTSQ